MLSERCIGLCIVFTLFKLTKNLHWLDRGLLISIYYWSLGTVYQCRMMAVYQLRRKIRVVDSLPGPSSNPERKDNRKPSQISDVYPRVYSQEKDLL